MASGEDRGNRKRFWGGSGENRYVGGCESCAGAVIMKGVERWDEFWKAVIDLGEDKCCYVLEIGRSGDTKEVDIEEKVEKRAKIIIPGGLARTVMIKLSGPVSLSIDLNFSVEEKSRFGMRVIGTLENGSDLSLNVASEQARGGSEFMLEGRVVCMKGSIFDSATKGVLSEQAGGSSCTYDVQVLQIGDGGKVSGKPKMEVLSKDVVADHGFAVGRIPEDVLLYMMGRGLMTKDAEELYSAGFLQSARSGISGD